MRAKDSFPLRGKVGMGVVAGVANAVPPASIAISQKVGAALASARMVIDAADARVLLCHVLQREPTYLITHADDSLDADHLRTFDALVARRRAGEPVAYLTGRREFYGLDIRVTPAVLIPRPETELLVELALERTPVGGDCSALDLGTGSGCIAIAIAKHRPRASVVAVDKSEAALAIARENGQAHGASNVEFRASDWFSSLASMKFDLIAANPPYVAAGDPHLEQGDLRHEPVAALVAGEAGLAALRVIAEAAQAHLGCGGWLLFEHGHEQGASCRSLLECANLAEVVTWRDFAGRERVSGGRRP